jgi:Na+/H+ antiporter NhaD/arsenite permease-like protein
MISVIILAIVFILIAVRQVGSLRLQIWQIMLGGAIAMLLTLQITPLAALRAINLDVMLFLFAMFIIGQALEESGYLAHLSFKLFRKASSTDMIVVIMLFGMGLLSAVLMNDTLAIVGTPVALLLSRKHKISSKLLLLSLAFAITIGSIMSPIGNPQNLLIALQMQDPFINFLRHLFLPTILSLAATYIILKLIYPKEFHKDALVHTPEAIHDEQLASLCKMSLVLILALITLKIVLVFFGTDFRITYIALIGMLPILLSSKRFGVIRRIDWYTLIFFAAMFVVMEAVWISGFFQSLIAGVPLTNILVILLLGVVLSQFISNVPMVALFMPLLLIAGGTTKELIALAAGSTLAGSLLILGAASNVIIIQNAEKSGETLTFWEFAKAGIPVTVMSLFIFWLFL